MWTCILLLVLLLLLQQWGSVSWCAVVMQHPQSTFPTFRSLLHDVLTFIRMFLPSDSLLLRINNPQELKVIMFIVFTFDFACQIFFHLEEFGSFHCSDWHFVSMSSPVTMVSNSLIWFLLFLKAVMRPSLLSFFDLLLRDKEQTLQQHDSYPKHWSECLGKVIYSCILFKLISNWHGYIWNSG